MLHRLFGHIRQNVVAWLALFVALGGTSAYAANTIRTGDIVDNEVYTTDVRDDTLPFGNHLSVLEDAHHPLGGDAGGPYGVLPLHDRVLGDDAMAGVAGDDLEAHIRAGIDLTQPYVVGVFAVAGIEDTLISSAVQIVEPQRRGGDERAVDRHLTGVTVDGVGQCDGAQPAVLPGAETRDEIRGQQLDVRGGPHPVEHDR